MNGRDEGKIQGDVLFEFLNHLYGHRFTPEMEEELRAGLATVEKTVTALRAVRMDRVGDPSLPFSPYRKEG
jgi:hypothetical protein